MGWVFFPFKFGSRLITFIYIFSSKGHGCEIIPDTFRWSFMTRIITCELYHLGDGAKSIVSEGDHSLQNISFIEMFLLWGIYTARFAGILLNPDASL